MTRRSVLPIGTVGGAEVTADSAERGVCSGARTASPGDGRILGICSGSCLERRGSRNAGACATAGEPEGGSRRAAAKGGSRIGRCGPSCGIWRATRGILAAGLESEGRQPETWPQLRTRASEHLRFRASALMRMFWHLSCQGRMCAGAKIRRQARLRELSCALPLDCPADLWYKYR